MKVAIIGCSYSDYFQELTDGLTGKRSWTYKLSELYPQHQFRNYAKGATGADYQKVCFYECYDWADLILIQKTHENRRTLFLNFLDSDSLTWNSDTSHNNYKVMRSNLTCVNLLPTGNFIDDHGNATRYPQIPMLKKFFNQVSVLLTTNNLYNDIDEKWYSHISKDNKVKILDFRKESKGAWNVFGTLDLNELHGKGYTNRVDDDHWTDQGHTLVLNQYILSKDLKQCLK